MADDPRVTLTGAVLGRLGRPLLLGHPPWCECPRCLELDGDAAGLAGALARAARHNPPAAAAAPPPPLPALLRAPKPVAVRVAKAARPKALPAGGGSARAARASPAGGDPPEVEVEVIPPGAPVRRRRKR